MLCVEDEMGEWSKEPLLQMVLACLVLQRDILVETHMPPLR